MAKALVGARDPMKSFNSRLFESQPICHKVAWASVSGPYGRMTARQRKHKGTMGKAADFSPLEAAFFADAKRYENPENWDFSDLEEPGARSWWRFLKR